MEYLMMLQEKLPMIAEYLGYIVIMATAAARMIPGKGDDDKVAEYSSLVWKFISWLPTLGINPNTQKLKEAYDKLEMPSSDS